MSVEQLLCGDGSKFQFEEVRIVDGKVGVKLEPKNGFVPISAHDEGLQTIEEQRVFELLFPVSLEPFNPRPTTD